MQLLFTHSWRRIDRASFHIKAFQSEWERINAPGSYEFLTEHNSDWTSGHVRAIARTPGEHSLALELGEFFYNLRSALDSTIYQAAILLENSDPPSQAYSLEFPICDTADRFKKVALYKRKFFPQDLVSWLTSIQPYKVPETSDPAILKLMKYLLLLHDCARKDRHRLPHIVAAFPTHISCKFHVTPTTMRTFNHRGVRVNFLESDDPFFFFDIAGFDLSHHCHIKLETKLKMEVFIDEIPVPEGSSLQIEIKGMFEAVHRVVEYFELWFRQEHADLPAV